MPRGETKSLTVAGKTDHSDFRIYTFYFSRKVMEDELALAGHRLDRPGILLSPTDFRDVLDAVFFPGAPAALHTRNTMSVHPLCSLTK